MKILSLILLFVLPFHVQAQKKSLDFAEVMPEYPGGHDSLVAFIVREFVYPEEAERKEEEGTVYVSFIVGKDGNLSEIDVVKGVSKSLDAEVKRIVGLMPKWRPGEQAGKPVNVTFTMPIKCTLAKEKKKKRFIKK